MTTNRKRNLKSDFALFKASSILLNVTLFVKCWRNFLELKPKGLYLSLEKENFSVLLRNLEVSCRSRATTAKKCTKERDARAKLLFC